VPPVNPGTTGLISWWPFDDASGTRFDAHGSNDLTDNNTVTTATAKVGANAAQFTIANAEFFSVADNASISPTAAWSWSQWVYFDALSGDQALAAKWEYNTPGAGSWGIEATGAELRAFIKVNNSDGGVNRGVSSGTSLTTGTWHHVTVVYDGSGAANADRLKFYIDGTAKTITFTGTIPAATIDSTGALNVGKFGGSLTRYLGGRADEPSFWSIALSADNVEWLYNSGAGRAYSELAGGSRPVLVGGKLVGGGLLLRGLIG